MAVIEAIATTYLEADAATVTFSSIPATYEHLQLRVSSHDTYDATWDVLYAQFNDDSGTNYSYHYMDGYSGANSGAGGGTGKTHAWLGKAEGSFGATLATTYGVLVVDILDYANANKNTSCQFNSYVAGVPDLFFESGLWDATAAVSSIVMTGTLDITRGSEFTLYGIKSS